MALRGMTPDDTNIGDVVPVCSGNFAAGGQLGVDVRSNFQLRLHPRAGLRGAEPRMRG